MKFLSVDQIFKKVTQNNVLKTFVKMQVICSATQNTQTPSIKTKVALPKTNKERYAVVRASRSGMAMCEMMQATDLPDKVVTFLH